MDFYELGKQIQKRSNITITTTDNITKIAIKKNSHKHTQTHKTISATSYENNMIQMQYAQTSKHTHIHTVISRQIITR